MERRLRFAAALVALSAVTFAPCASPAQVRKTKDGYLLRMKWTKGASYIYEITITAELSPGQTLPMKSGLSMKVLGVSDGVASVEFTKLDPLTGEPSTQVLQADGLGFLDDEGLSSGMGGPNLPKQAVRPGDSWTAETAGIVMGVEVTTKSVYTFKRLERIGDVPCVALSVETVATTSKFTATGTGIVYIETRNGHIYKSELQNKIELDNNGQTLTILATVVTVRK